MTTTIQNTNSNDIQALSFYVDNFADFQLIDTKIDGDNREAVYSLVGGDADYPRTVRIGWYYKPEANDGVGQVNVSIKMQAMIEDTESDDPLPCTFTLALAMPGQNVNAHTALGIAVMHLLSWLYPGTTTGSATTPSGINGAFISSLGFGVPNFDLTDASETV